MSNITFNAWIGSNYGKSTFGKLLIIGDSHYWPYHPKPTVYSNDFTQRIIADDISLNAKFFKNIAKLFGKTDFSEIRDDICFANAIQEFMENSQSEPTKLQILACELSLREYIETTDPDKVLVFSSRIWEGNFNKEKDWGEYLETMTFDKRKGTVWKFNKENGKVCYGIGLYHPSAPQWKLEEWKPLVNNFLSKY
jgi:hypothetical protein